MSSYASTFGRDKQPSDQYLQIISGILKTHPDLTASGFGLQEPYKRYIVGKHSALLEEDRSRLFDKASEEGFWAAVSFLEPVRRTQRISRNAQSSYALKHRVEESFEGVYVPEGAFIAAAIYKGLIVRRQKDSNSARFNIDPKCVPAPR